MHRLPDRPDPRLPNAIARLALVVGVVIALSIPSAFLAIGYQAELVRLETALGAGVQRGVEHRQVRPAGPDAQARAAVELIGFLAELDGQMNIRIIGAERRVLAKTERALETPLVRRNVSLDRDNAGSARLELSRSLRPLLLQALLIAAPGAVLGWVIFIALRDVPMRAFRIALQEAEVRKETEERLAKSLSIFSATLESTADGILVTDVLGRAVVANQRFIHLWNQPSTGAAGEVDPEAMFALATQLRQPSVFLATQKDLTKHIGVDHGAVLELRDGRLFEWNSRPQFIDGSVVGRVSSFRDISERKRAEALLAAEKEVLEMVVCGTPLSAALGVLARHLEVLSGQMFCAIVFRETGESNATLLACGPNLPQAFVNSIAQHGQSALDAMFTDVTARVETKASEPPREGGGMIEGVDIDPAWSGYRSLIARMDIEIGYAVSVHSTAGHLMAFIVAHYRRHADLPRNDRELIRVAAHLTRIAIERRQAETQLRFMAHYDALTLLPNRDLFRDRLKQALAQAERRCGLLAVMFLDLDRFKTVNDTLGHDAGDVLLREVSARLRGCIRDEDTVARLGGDEFTVLLHQINRPDDAGMVAGKIVEALGPPILLSGQEAFVTPSIGISVYPTDSSNAETLMKNADTAMYHAKQDGGNGYRYFNAEMNTMAAGRLVMESGLRRALEREEFVVYYQPKLNLADGTITGAEALLRWKHPERGLVPPGEFIHILEETGLIEPVGEWVLRRVCAQIRAWQDEGIGSLTVAVNLSGRQLQHNNIADTIAAILEETGLDPSLLELEVTESMLMHDPKFAADMLDQIRAKGVVHIGVDDFGTGYSSLNYLKRFPIDALKLDKSFVDGLPDDQDDAAISRAVIALGHNLKLKIIAEGVETEAQRAFLQEIGCDFIQGYVVSKPLPAEVLAQMLRERQHESAWSDGASVVRLPVVRRTVAAANQSQSA